MSNCQCAFWEQASKHPQAPGEGVNVSGYRVDHSASGRRQRFSQYRRYWDAANTAAFQGPGDAPPPDACRLLVRRDAFPKIGGESVPAERRPVLAQVEMAPRLPSRPESRFSAQMPARRSAFHNSLGQGGVRLLDDYLLFTSFRRPPPTLPEIYGPRIYTPNVGTSGRRFRQ
jgi:hypothetical protein